MPNIPVPSEGGSGRLLAGGVAGDCVSLSKWRLFIPENYKQLDNYCLAPMGVVGSPKAYVQCSGMWDLANPPHKPPYVFVYGISVVLWLGMLSTTHGYLGTFKIASEEAGHGVLEGGDFQFNAYLQGVLLRYPL